MSKIYNALILSLFCLFSCVLNAQVHPKYPDKVYTTVDQMPCFDCKGRFSQSCCEQALQAFLLEHLVYPEAAKKAGLEGLVKIRFVLDKFGFVTVPEIIEDIGQGCGAEALRVVKLMPEWMRPGMQANQYVAVQFDLPVRFSLNGKNGGGPTVEMDIEDAAKIMGTFFFIMKKMAEKDKKKSKD